MMLSTKAMDSPLGLRITFETAPVVKFHVAAKLPNPADPYRVDVTITMPEDREDLWLDGVNAAFRRVQNGNGWAVRLDYANAIRHFNINQLNILDKRNPGFSMHLYSVPQTALSQEIKTMKPIASTQDFARSYYRQRKEAAHNGTVCERIVSSADTADAV